MLDEAFALTSRNGERAHEAELHRLQGELLLAGGTADDAIAEYCFPEALAVARRQEARSLALRAATSLARFYANRGRCDDALHVLAPIHGCFTEGFGTADLKEAKTLLDELASMLDPPGDQRRRTV